MSAGWLPVGEVFAAGQRGSAGGALRRHQAPIRSHRAAGEAVPEHALDRESANPVNLEIPLSELTRFTVGVRTGTFRCRVEYARMRVAPGARFRRSNSGGTRQTPAPGPGLIQEIRGVIRRPSHRCGGRTWTAGGFPEFVTRIAASTAQHGTGRHGTARHGTARHSTAQHGTTQHGTRAPTAQDLIVRSSAQTVTRTPRAMRTGLPLRELSLHRGGFARVVPR